MRDHQTVFAGGARAETIKIGGVQVRELGNVLTRSGFLTEIFRTDWISDEIVVRQVNWVQLNPAGVTDWHVHAKQTDRIAGVGGTIKLALWDGRASSPTKGATEIFRMGRFDPCLSLFHPACGTRFAMKATKRPAT